MSIIYLDFNRTTPVAPSVVQAMQPYWSTHFMLPGQQHPQAQAIGEAMESARESVAAMAGCEPFEIVFTGGGTESNNLGILGAIADQPTGHILVSQCEHESVLSPLNRLGRSGWEIEPLVTDRYGWVDPESVAHSLRPETRLVCLQAANPVTGVLQDVRAVADICHNRGVFVHCDASQVFGKMPFDVGLTRADTVAISGHKFYGPKGTGAVFVRRGLKLSPVAFGEPREMGLRPGAENVPGCIGMGAAAGLVQRCCVDACDKMGELRAQFIERLNGQIGDQISVICDIPDRLPNTVTLRLPYDTRHLIQSARQLAFATAQSASPPDEFTRVLSCLDYSEDDISRIARFSFGWTTSSEQVERAADLVAEAFDGS